MGLCPARIASAVRPSLQVTLSDFSGPPGRLSVLASNEQFPGLFVVEPTSKAWEALVLPLNYTRVLALMLQNPMSILK